MRMARILAASDMAAGEAYPKLVPRLAKREAFLATAGARRYLSNLTHMFATLGQRYHIGVDRLTDSLRARLDARQVDAARLKPAAALRTPR